MSNVFTLDALRQETLSRYAPTVVVLPDESTVELQSILRLGKKDREAVVAAIDEIKDLDDDEDDDEVVDEFSESVCASIEKVIKLIANKPKKLLAELDHDDPRIKVTMYTSVLSRWMGESQLGEAEPSPA